LNKIESKLKQPEFDNRLYSIISDQMITMTANGSWIFIKQ